MVILCHCNQNFKESFTKQNMAKCKGVVHNAVGSSIYTLLSHTLKTQTHQYANNKLKNGEKEDVAWFYFDVFPDSARKKSETEFPLFMSPQSMYGANWKSSLGPLSSIGSKASRF